MTRVCAALLFFIVPLSRALSFDAGDLVAAKRESTLSVSGKTVDHLGPGQVLRVLAVQGTHLWVSRGRPGWIGGSEVVALDAAESYFDRQLEKEAGARNYSARGTVRIAVGKHTAGLADLVKATELARDEGEYFESLGFGYLAAHDQARAIKAFGEALGRNSASAPAFMGRGLAYYQAGRLQEAHEDLYEAIQLEPRHAFPRKYLGALLHDRGQLADAKKQLDFAVELDAYDVFSRKALGRLLFELGDYEPALQQFAVAVELDPRDLEALNGRGVIQHALGNDLAKAEADFAAAVQAAKPVVENAHLWSNLGQVQMERGNADDARRNLDRAIELDRDFNEARSHRAYLMALTNAADHTAIERAKADVRSVFASKQDKTFWDYRALAAVNAALGDYKRAARFQADAVELAHQMAPPRFRQRTADDLNRFRRLALQH